MSDTPDPDTDPDVDLGPADSPFEDPPDTGPPDSEPGSDPGMGDGSKAYDFWGLRSDSPDVSPSDVGDQLDLTADWWEHLFCGLLKQSGSDVAEAWQHHLIASILLLDEQYGILDPDDDRGDDAAAADDAGDGGDPWGELDE
jgi:hypothetical protein